MGGPSLRISKQLTWTVFSQVHFSGQALAWDLSSLKLQPSTLLQYVDDLLLCKPTLTYSQDYTPLLLNSFPYHRLNTWGSF
jgi:hypothetical protein